MIKVKCLIVSGAGPREGLVHCCWTMTIQRSSSWAINQGGGRTLSLLKLSSDIMTIEVSLKMYFEVYLLLLLSFNMSFGN